MSAGWTGRALAVLVVLAACKQAKDPTPAGEVLAKSRELSAAICACTQRACAQPLLAQWNELTKELHGATFTDDQVQGLTTEDERVEKCVAALAP